MPVGNKGTRGKRPPARRRKHQAEWLREQIESEWPGFNPVMEMIRISKKPRVTARDEKRFAHCAEIAKFVQPRLKAVDFLPMEAGDKGELVIKWKG